MRDRGHVSGWAGSLLACVVGPLLGCSDGGGPSSTAPETTAGSGSGDGTASAGGAMPASDAGDPPDAGGLPDARGEDPDAGALPWWRRSTWQPVEWGPGECVISVLEDPTVIGPLEWEPMVLGPLAGETPVVPLGHTYAELPDGTSWAGGRVAAGESVVAVRDRDGAPIMGFKHATCQVQLASTRRGVCAVFVRIVGEPGAAACGDLRAPDPLIELERGGFIAAASEELLLVRGGTSNNDVNILDLSDDSVTPTTVPSHSFGEAAVHGRDVFAVYESSDPGPWRGILFGWDGADGYTQLRDAMPLEVVNVQTDGTHLVWTETEIGLMFTGTSLYRAALPVSAGSLVPVLVRKVEGHASGDSAALGAGLLATQTNKIELVRIADGVRWKVESADPWQVTGGKPFINDQALGFQVFDRNDSEQHWVTFRAKLADVLALPSD